LVDVTTILPNHSHDILFFVYCEIKSLAGPYEI
jgi:hypothetical protein